MAPKKRKFDWKAIHEAAALNRSYTEVLPPVVVLHMIGQASIVQINQGNRTTGYAATYKGVTKIAGSPESALMMLKAAYRAIYPRPRRIMRVRSEIIGWRIWQVIGDHLLPVAVQSDQFIYSGPVQVADQKPTSQNHSGFWAIKPHEKEFFIRLRRSYGQHMAFGEVGLFGRVVEHTFGYRAEKMIIRRLYLAFPASREFCDLMERRYDCECHVDTRRLDDFDLETLL